MAEAVTHEDIEQLDDIDDAIALLNKLGINSDEVEEMKDAQGLLYNYLKRQPGIDAEQWTPSSVSQAYINIFIP